MDRYVVVLMSKELPSFARVVGPLPKAAAFESRDRLVAASTEVSAQVRTLRDPQGWTDAELIQEVVF